MAGPGSAAPWCDTRLALSQENVEIVLRHIDAYNRRDLDAVLAGLSEDFVADWSRSGGLDGGVRHGRGDSMAFFQSTWEAFDPLRMTIEHVVDAGEHVVVDFSMHGRARITGLELSGPTAAQVWTVRDGLIAAATMYQTRDEALEALRD